MERSKWKVNQGARQKAGKVCIESLFAVTPLGGMRFVS
jgi:hypothetical protein